MDSMPIYAIRVQGRLDPRRAAWFDNLEIQPAPNGETLLYGPLVDQAALFGILVRIRDLGLKLVAVNTVEPFDA